jgi:hypothetical protein
VVFLLCFRVMLLTRHSPQVTDVSPSASQGSGLDGIVLHDAWLCSKVFLSATTLEALFKILYVPLVGPPVWVAWLVEQILSIAIISFLIAALVNAYFSIYFHFRRRIKRKK